MEPAPGAKVNERITLSEPLARGSFGTVWRAHHEGLGIDVAVKFLTGDGSPLRRDAIKRFAIEASAAAQLQSPHVVRMFDHGVTEDRTPYLVMELMQGESLAERLKTERRLSLEETVTIIAQSAKALDSAHALGVIHRDIKPSNLFLTKPHGETLVKVLDFGVAKQTHTAKPGSVITEPGMIVGTPAYLCRDIFVARASLADPQVDLWALAVVAYRCLCGRLPFDGETIPDTCKAIIKGSYAKPSTLRPELGEKVDHWFARAFALEKRDRFFNARELGNSFAALGKSATKLGTHRNVYALAVGAVILVAAAIVWGTRRTPKTAPPLPAVSAAPAMSKPVAPTASLSLAPPITTSSGPPPPARPGEIFVPGGQVVLGSSGPRVSIDAFFLERSEVTVLAYGKCVMAGACNDRRVQIPVETGNASLKSAQCNWHQTRREAHPMNCVTWSQADGYCRWAGARLPSEAEWMRAARGDDARGFPWGDVAPSCERTVMADGDGAGCGRKATWPAGSQPLDRSPLGIVDLAGNLREWVADWFASAVDATPVSNPKGPELGTERVVKGGSFTDMTDLGIAARHSMNPDERSVSVGFRCARSKTP